MQEQTARVLSVTDLELAFKHDKPHAQIMTITPTIAKYLLSTSAGNRRFRAWWVKVLAGAIRRGEWEVTSQGVGIDIHGRLRDAHHRLQACVDTGINITIVVVTGISERAYSVTDTGLKRRTEDLLGIKKNVADTVRLAASIYYGLQTLTSSQLRPVLDSDIGKVSEDLVSFCGKSARYYSSAPMKLAAVCSVLNGSDPDYVFSQYRALCTWNLGAQSAASQALVKQVETGRAVAANGRDALARGLKVFDSSKKDLSKIYATDDDSNRCYPAVREIVAKAIHANA